MRSPRLRLAVGVIWAACLSLFAAFPSPADEGTLVGIGGTYRLMRGESTVRLAREFLDVRFSSRLARTVVQFEFQNEGPSQTVTMGFPEQTVYTRGRYRHFQVELDGRPLAARPTRWITDERHTHWSRWWVSTVQFGRGERHLVRVSYEEPPGSDEAGDTYRYLFGTGRTWKGPIGLVEVKLTLEGYPPDAALTADLPNPTRKGNRFAWRFENWEPDADADLDMAVDEGITRAVSDRKSPDPPADLTQGFAVQLDLPKPAPVGQVKLHLVLRNVTSEPLTLADAYPEFDYRLTVTDASGKLMPPARLPNAAQRRVTLEMRPGESLTQDYDLARVYDPLADGQYTIVARRLELRVDGEGMGEVVSNPITIVVSGGQAKQVAPPPAVAASRRQPLRKLPLLAVRPILKRHGFRVLWDPAEHTMMASKGKLVVVIDVRKGARVIDGRESRMGRPTKLARGQLSMPGQEISGITNLGASSLAVTLHSPRSTAPPGGPVDFLPGRE